mgnify:FL=1
MFPFHNTKVRKMCIKEVIGDTKAVNGKSIETKRVRSISVPLHHATGERIKRDDLTSSYGDLYSRASTSGMAHPSGKKPRFTSNGATAAARAASKARRDAEDAAAATAAAIKKAADAIPKYTSSGRRTGECIFLFRHRMTEYFTFLYQYYMIIMLVLN